jgi:hypothetical protein
LIISVNRRDCGDEEPEVDNRQNYILP